MCETVAANTPLIINADDFGYSSAVNRAVIQAHRCGVLTSASLMINESAADEAIVLARQRARIDQPFPQRLEQDLVDQGALA